MRGARLLSRDASGGAPTRSWMRCPVAVVGSVHCSCTPLDSREHLWCSIDTVSAGLLGRRLLMLEHRGRTSGQWRQVCLEIIDRPAPGTFRIVSGLGPRSQWYRNLTADPHCFIHTGPLRRAAAVAHRIPQHAVPAALEKYMTQNSRGWKVLAEAMAEDLPAGMTFGEWLPIVDLVLESRGA